MTWWHKRAGPTIWFGVLGLFTLAGIAGVIGGDVPAPAALIPPGMAAFGYFIFRWFIFPLVDAVFIDGDEMIVRNRGQEERFPINRIINVDSSIFINPERIVLTLKEPCGFGREIVFSPPHRWWPFGRHPIAEELMRRAHGID